ncbi:type II toxin-antitoxin system Phd/YefM family antitoxin [Marinobacterium rhizophilum]|uniref:Antitoxin n=1 Tax=Marinobacterium rhizophilum TaxID=420402 RepID=A0ABY5HGP4_9GAMM|nr:type II toxin-antitoxin system Phd/YefM family antitoxin [Marinobacterium rhizophilum]UTW11532.1 type II toxin-antitoxin system Phd/YefM family antitoxin [Marinobacterium rhizophilum]
MSVERMMAGISASITDFKANPNAIIQRSGGEAVAVLKSNVPCFYAVPPELFEMMSEAVEDLALLTQARERLGDGKEPVEVNIDDL